MTLPVRRLAAPLALALLTPVCRPVPARPSLLLVTIDTLRADRLGCYGAPRPITPALDRLAAEGVRVAEAYAAAPITAPSHASLLTGRHPLRHGVRTNGLYLLAEEETTLAELLSQQGYGTAAFVGAVPLDRRFGFAQGFATYDDDFRGSVLAGHDTSPWYEVAIAARERRADEVIDRAISWLEGAAPGPFFLWVHLFDPHSPYAPPPPYDRRFLPPGDPRSPANRSLDELWRAPQPWHDWLRGTTDAAYVQALYDGEVAFADAQVGRLLQALERLGRAAGTAVAVTSDHGEGLGEHGEFFFHGDRVYEPTLRVPLLFRAPWRLPRGLVARVRARGIDLLPTLVDLLGLPAPDGIDGETLLPALAGAAAEPRPVLAEAAFRDRSGRGVFALLEGRLKVIESDGRDGQDPTLECYDLARDPRELRSLCAERQAEFAVARAHLAATRRDLAGPEPGAIEVPPEVLERLRSLGYQE